MNKHFPSLWIPRFALLPISLLLPFRSVFVALDEEKLGAKTVRLSSSFSMASSHALFSHSSSVANTEMLGDAEEEEWPRNRPQENEDESEPSKTPKEYLFHPKASKDKNEFVRCGVQTHRDGNEVDGLLRKPTSSVVPCFTAENVLNSASTDIVDGEDQYTSTPRGSAAVAAIAGGAAAAALFVVVVATLGAFLLHERKRRQRTLQPPPTKARRVVQSEVDSGVRPGSSASYTSVVDALLSTTFASSSSGSSPERSDRSKVSPCIKPRRPVVGANVSWDESSAVDLRLLEDGDLEEGASERGKRTGSGGTTTVEEPPGGPLMEEGGSERETTRDDCLGGCRQNDFESWLMNDSRLNALSRTAVGEEEGIANNDNDKHWQGCNNGENFFMAATVHGGKKIVVEEDDHSYPFSVISVCSPRPDLSVCSSMSDFSSSSPAAAATRPGNSSGTKSGTTTCDDDEMDPIRCRQNRTQQSQDQTRTTVTVLPSDRLEVAIESSSVVTGTSTREPTAASEGAVCPVIFSLAAGSPLARKVSVGDPIVAVNGADTARLSPSDVARIFTVLSSKDQAGGKAMCITVVGRDAWDRSMVARDIRSLEADLLGKEWNTHDQDDRNSRGTNESRESVSTLEKKGNNGTLTATVEADVVITDDAKSRTVGSPIISSGTDWTKTDINDTNPCLSSQSSEKREHSELC